MNVLLIVLLMLGSAVGGALAMRGWMRTRPTDDEPWKLTGPTTTPEHNQPAKPSQS